MIVILPPKVQDADVVNKINLLGSSYFCLLNPPFQKKILNKLKDLDKNKIKFIDDFIDNSDEFINERAIYFARNWSKRGELNLHFRGIDIGSLFISFSTYYFIGILKSLVVFDRIISTYKNDEYILIDDNTFWSKSFKFLALSYGCKFKIIAYDNKEKKKKNIIEKFFNPSNIKTVTKRLLSAAYRLKSIGSIPEGGIMFSCAPSFILPLIKFIKQRNIYYYRPEFSIKTAKQTLKYSNFHHITPEYFNNASLENHIVVDSICKNINDFFSSTEFFTYKKFNIWEIVKDSLLKEISRNINYCLNLISQTEKAIEELKPKAIFLEEESALFNRVLLEVAKKYCIPTYHIFHGVLGYKLFLDKVESTKILLPGQSCFNRMNEFGVNENKLCISGYPHWQAKIEEILKEKNDIYNGSISRLRIKNRKKKLILATYPFHSEERPDFIGSYSTADNLEKMISIAAEAVRKYENIKLIVKFHPREKREWFTKDILEKEGILNKVVLEKNIESMKLLLNGDLLLCGGSTIYWEALLLKIPVLIFDKKKKRSLEFLNKDYLDLDNKIESVERIHRLLYYQEEKELRLKEQEYELGYHFLDKNELAVDRFCELIESEELNFSTNFIKV